MASINTLHIETRLVLILILIVLIVSITLLTQMMKMCLVERYLTSASQLSACSHVQNANHFTVQLEQGQTTDAIVNSSNL